MSQNRREFLRRVLASSLLLTTGVVSSWELIHELLKSSAPGIGVDATSSSGILQSSPASSQAMTAQQTVTVTEYVSGGSTQVSSGNETSASNASTTTTQPVPAGYVLVAPLSALAGRTSAYFNHPSRGISLLINVAGQWKAFGATCTHAPCTVQYAGASVSCPCHGGSYNPSNGAVLGGPPPAPLPQYGVLIVNGDLYVTA